MTNKEVIKGLYENFARGDVPAVVALFDDITDYLPATIIQSATISSSTAMGSDPLPTTMS